jgi:hypothetical protein
METQEYESPSVELEPEEEKSAFDRFAEVFTAPSEAFRGLPLAKKGPTILWGLLITALVMVFSVILLSTNDKLLDEVRDRQFTELERQKEKGKIPDKVYEQQLEILEMTTSRGAFIGFGIGGGVLVVCLMILAVAVAVAIFARMFAREGTARAGFASAMAATVIAFMISNVESLITTIGMYVTSDMGFRLSPAAFVDTENSLLKFVTGLPNPFTIWLWFALGTAIAYFSGAGRLKSTIAIAIFWILGGVIITGLGTLISTAFTVS